MMTDKILVSKDPTTLPPQVDRVIEAILIGMMSEFNTPKARKYIKDVISSTLEYFIDDEPFTIICDESNNSVESREKGELNVKIEINGVEIPYTIKSDPVRV